MTNTEGKMPAPPRILGAEELEKALPRLEGWRLAENRLERWFECADFPAAVAWVTRLVDPAETMGHHPDVDVRYRRVRIALVTHDCGARVTDWDVELASRINRLWQTVQAASSAK